jgi:hypothetical protein
MVLTGEEKPEHCNGEDDGNESAMERERREDEASVLAHG